VQAVNDLVAVGCAETLLAQGLRVPEDISVAGFGNVMVAEHFRVPMTTIRQPKFRLGVAAVDAMMQLLKGQRPETKRLTAELIERKSTAPPKAGAVPRTGVGA
jgi:LacI family transcriptional regulator